MTVEEFESVYLESQVAHSTALHSHTIDRNPYFVGPLARLNINFDKLRAVARKATEDIGLEIPLKNPYKSLIARAIELVEFCDVAVELLETYDPQEEPYVEIILKDGEGYGISEAPRGILYHRYKAGEDGLIKFAKITPPTAQNYPRIEADLWNLAQDVISRPHKEASLACEHLIRSYDPISCSTHFFKLTIENDSNLTT